MKPREARRLRTAELPSGSWRRAHDPPVDLLQPIRCLRPARRGAWTAPGKSPAQLAVLDQARELAAKRDRVTRREQQPELAVLEQLLVDPEMRGDGDRSGGQRRPHDSGCDARPARGGADDIGMGDERLGLAVGGTDDPHPVAEPLSDPRQRLGQSVRPHDRLPSRLGGESAQGAIKQPQRAALLALAVGDPHRPAVLTRRSSRCVRQIRAGTNELIGSGEVALDQLRGLAAAHGARVQTPEEDLDERPRDLGREQPLGRLVEAADVERVRVAERRRGGAGRERIVDVDDVEWDRFQQPLERPADVERHGRRARARAARHRDPLADREHTGRRTVAREQRSPV